MFLDLFMCPFLFYKCSNAVFKDGVDFNTEECFPVSVNQLQYSGISEKKQSISRIRS